MTTFKIKTMDGSKETVTADSYEITDGWLHFSTARDGNFDQTASYPAAQIFSIRGEAPEPNVTVKVHISAPTDEAAEVWAAATKYAGRAARSRWGLRG